MVVILEVSRKSKKSFWCWKLMPTFGASEKFYINFFVKTPSETQTQLNIFKKLRKCLIQPVVDKEHNYVIYLC